MRAYEARVYKNYIFNKDLITKNIKLQNKSIKRDNNYYYL
jgi:hypothetical protein